MGEVTGIDFNARYVKLNGSVIAYDYLVIAVGAETNFFGTEAVERNGFQVKDIQSAILTRNHLLKLFEQASHEVEAEKRRAMLTFVVAGGGPTGVETAGALAELVTRVMAKDFPLLEMEEARIILLESNDYLITAYPHELRHATFELLQGKNVTIRLNSSLTDFDGRCVTLPDGAEIATHTLIWTAGVRAAPVLDLLGVEQAGGGRVRVEPTLQLPKHPEVFILGDAAYLTDRNGQPLPMLSTVAIQAGKGRGPEYPANHLWSGTPPIPLQGSGFAGHHRAQRGGGAPLGYLIQRISRMGGLGVPAPLSPDRFPQSHSGVHQRGPGLHLL